MTDLPTPAAHTTFIVTRSVLPRICDAQGEQTPIPGVPLTQEQRRGIGLTHAGETVAYEYPDTHLLVDLAGATVTTIYAGADAESALLQLDAALRRDFAGLAQQTDGPHPHGGKRRFRHYEGDLNAERRAKIEVDYPEPGATGADNRFVVRVMAFKREVVAAPQAAAAPPAAAPAAPPPPEPPKKKGWF